MPGISSPKNPPQAVIRESDFVWFVNLFEAQAVHKKNRGAARWFPKGFLVHRSDIGHAFIDKEDGTCPRCRAGESCKPVRLPAVDITPAASPRALKAEDEHLYNDELRELLELLPSRLRMEMGKFDLDGLSREQMQRLAQEASEVLRDHRVTWIQPDGSKTVVYRTLAKMPFADIVRAWFGKAKLESRKMAGDSDFSTMSETEIRAWIHDRIVEAGKWTAVEAAAHRAAVKQALAERQHVTDK